MLKQFILFIFILSSLSIFSETLYEVLLKNGEIVTGYIKEDKTGEVVVIESDNDGELFVILYKDITTIRIKGKTLNPDNVIIKQDIAEPIIENKIQIISPEINIDITPPLAKDFYINELKDKSLFQLYNYQFSKDEITTLKPEIVGDIYNELEKTDTLKYTLLNIIPGLGSMLQGDYYSGIYALSSVLGSVVYNLTNTGTGPDYYFVVNLNGILAYTTSFLAPLRYNRKYNQTVKDKLPL